MNNKRIFLVIGLSFLVLILWQRLVNKLYPVDNKEVTERISYEEAKISDPNSSKAATLPVFAKSESEPVTLDKMETDKLKIEFINPGGKIYKVYLKDYGLVSGITGALYSKIFKDELYALEKLKDELKISTAQNGHYLMQTLKFHNNSYYMELETVYGNDTSSNWTFSDKLILDSASANTKPDENRLFEAVFLNQVTKRKNPLGIKEKYFHLEELNALAFRDRYSCIVISPHNVEQQKIQGYIEKFNGAAEVGFELDNITVPANSKKVFKYFIYCGPQDTTLLKQSKLGFEEIVYYGSFDFISAALLSVMNLFYKLSHSWGVSLILLSLFIFFVLYPLTIKQLRSMKEMQELQPQIEVLRKNHKDNPQKLNKEIMELYRRNKVNPLGGCLPMILQIPIFFGLYQTLSRSIVLKGSRFLWIKDLAEPDRLFVFSKSLPFIGQEINILPILMGATMFIQQKISSKANMSNSTAMEQQKIMLVLFPVMFSFIFYHFPSGLALYWFISTLLSTLSQWKILKKNTVSPARTN